MDKLNDKRTANMNTILGINCIDVKIPKVKYLVFIDGKLQRIKTIDIHNNNVVLTSVFNNIDENYRLNAVRDKFVKLTSIHPKITHAIQHTCINSIIKSITAFSEAINSYGNDVITPDSIVKSIIDNTLKFPLIGKVIPCYVFPKESDHVVVTSHKVITDFQLNNINNRNAIILDIYRNNKTTVYTIKTDICDIMCDRSDFKLVGKKDCKDLFYIL